MIYFTHVPGMLHVATSLCSLVSIMQDRNIYSVATVGELVYSFVLNTILFFRSAHTWPLIFRSFFASGKLVICGKFYSLIYWSSLDYKDGWILVCIVASFPVGLLHLQLLQIRVELSSHNIAWWICITCPPDLNAAWYIHNIGVLVLCSF